MSTSNNTIALSVSDTPGELTVRTVTVEHKKTTLKRTAKKDDTTQAAVSLENSHGNDTSSFAGINPMGSSPTSPSPSSSLSSLPVILVTKVNNHDEDEEEKKKKKRRKIGAGWCCCCPWYVLAALLAVTALAIGLGVGLGMNKNDGTPITTTPSIKLYNLDLKFNTYQKEVNLTLVSTLRCLVANLTDPTQFKRILMTSWEEYNGTTYFVSPEHPLNEATNCTMIDSALGFRRLQQLNNNWIFPIDPITVNISTVPRPNDENYTFINDLYNSVDIQSVAMINSIQEVRPNEIIPLPPSPSSTPTPTPTGTGTGTPSNTPTPSETPSSSETPTASSTMSASPTPSTTQTLTSTPSTTPSVTPTSSVSASNSPTASVTPSTTPSSSFIPSASPGPFLLPFPLQNRIMGLNDEVLAFTVYNGKLYMGGLFTLFDDGVTSANHIVTWDGTSWSNLTSGNSNGVNYEVYAFAVYNSKLYIGGSFTLLGDGTIAKFIVGWDGTSWSLLPSGSSNGVNQLVNVLAVYNGKLYLGGGFTKLGDGTVANRIVAWDGTSFSTLPCGTSNGVASNVFGLAVYNSKLYLGGQFLSLGNGTVANRIVAWDGASSKWATLGSGPVNGIDGVTVYVYALTVYNNKLHVGGTFSSMGDGTAAKRIVAWDGTSWSTLGPSGTNNGLTSGILSLIGVFSFVVYNNKLYISGSFTTLGDGTTSNRIVTWDGTSFSSLTVGAGNGIGDNTVMALAEYNGNIYLGGSFNFYGKGDESQSAHKIAIWNPSLSKFSLPMVSTTPRNAGFFGTNCFGATVFQNELYIGGAINGLADGSMFFRNVVKYNGTSFTSLPSGNTNGIDWEVHAFAEYNNKLYMGGPFTLLGDGTTSANGVAAWDGSSWSTLASGSSNGVYKGTISAFAVYNSKLYMGGYFTKLGDGITTVNHIAGWDGTTWFSLSVGNSKGVGSSVFALGVYNNKLYIGGYFTTLGDGTSAKYIAVWDGTSIASVPSGASNGVNKGVYAFLVYNSKLYMGGDFTVLGDGTSAKRIAAYDGTSWSNLPSDNGNGVSSSVFALESANGRLYIGGAFSDVNGSSNGVVSWDGTTLSNVYTGNSIQSGEVMFLKYFGGKIIVGGTYTSIGTNPPVSMNLLGYITI